MRIRVLQHVPFEGPGTIADWALCRGHTLEIAPLFDGASPDGAAACDMLVVLGGPMSVHDEAALPWLAPEKRAIARAMADGKAVLGICLGAQLIAEALGAEVTRNPHREIGWFPLRRDPTAPPAGPGDALADGLDAFHWHGETFGMPAGAARLASTEACANQAFIFGERVIGLQFHLETTPENARNLVAHCADEMDGGPFVQDPRSILADGTRFADANRAMARLLDALGGESA